jgi:hypothetical protein
VISLHVKHIGPAGYRAVPAAFFAAALMLLSGSMAAATTSSAGQEPPSVSCPDNLHAYKPYRTDPTHVQVNGEWDNCSRKWAKVCVRLWAFWPTPGPNPGWVPVAESCVDSLATPGPASTGAIEEWTTPGMFLGEVVGFDGAGNPIDGHKGETFAD